MRRRVILSVSIVLAIGLLLFGFYLLLQEPEQTPGRDRSDISGTETPGAEVIAPISLQKAAGEEKKAVVDSQEKTVEPKLQETEEALPEATTVKTNAIEKTPVHIEDPQEEKGAPEEIATPEPSVTPKPSATQESEQKREEVPAEAPNPTSTPLAAQHVHTYEKIYWYGEPSCATANNYYNLLCSECGENGGDGEDTVAHSPNSTSYESTEGCRVYRIVESFCEVCDADLGREEVFLREEHDWITGVSDPVWNEEQQEFVSREIVYCSRCFREK